MSEESDIANLEKRLRPLTKEEKEYWLFQLATCRESARGSRHLSYWQSIERYDREKWGLIFALSRILTGKKTHPRVKKGVEAFMELSKDEREAFYKTVLENTVPQKVARQKSFGLSQNSQHGHDRT